MGARTLLIGALQSHMRELWNAMTERDHIYADPKATEVPPQWPMREVPPGFNLRVLLGQALFSHPDVLLLDEPTNDMDVSSVRWPRPLLLE